MATIRDVAKSAGVSIATVSRVVNNTSKVGGDVRERVLEAVNRCGYVANVGRRPTSFIALAYTGPSSLGSPYDAALFEGMSDAMGETDYDLVVLNLQRDKAASESFSQFFFRKGVRGVILRTTSRTRSICQRIADEGFPVVVVGDRFEGRPIGCVGGESRTTSHQAVEHLLGLGHRRIAIAMNAVRDSDHLDRFEGYRQALADYGIELDQRLVFRLPASRPDGSQVIRKMMSMPDPPTAVFITDPAVAVGAINQSHRMGVRIPEELSVVGFDDTDIRHIVYPTMTAICQDARQLGYEAFTAMAQLLEDRNGATPPQRMFATWLEIHDTTGRPPTDRIRILPDGSRVVESRSSDSTIIESEHSMAIEDVVSE